MKKMKIIFMILLMFSMTNVLKAQIFNTAMCYFDLNSVIRSNESNQVQSDRLSYDFWPSYNNEIAVIGKIKYYSHQLQNLGDIALTFQSPLLSSSRGYSVSIYKDNGAVGTYENGVDTLLTNLLTVNQMQIQNLLLGITIPENFNLDGKYETTTIIFSIDTNSIPSPFSPSILAYQKSVIDVSLIRIPVIVKYITDGIDKITIYNGKGVLRNLTTTIRFTLSENLNNKKNVYIVYKTSEKISGSQGFIQPSPTWDISSENKQRVKCRKNKTYWEIAIPFNEYKTKKDCMVEFVIVVDNVIYYNNQSIGWKFKIRVLNIAQGFTTILNNVINPENNELAHLVFYFKERSRVKISLYDVSGRKIRTLLESHGEPGENIINWNGSNQNGDIVSNGVYILEIDSDEYYEIKKIVVVKR